MGGGALGSTRLFLIWSRGRVFCNASKPFNCCVPIAAWVSPWSNVLLKGQPTFLVPSQYAIMQKLSTLKMLLMSCSACSRDLDINRASIALYSYLFTTQRSWNYDRFSECLRGVDKNLPPKFIASLWDSILKCEALQVSYTPPLPQISSHDCFHREREKNRR